MGELKTNKRKELRFSVHDGKAQIESTGGIFAFLKGHSKALPIININTIGLQLLAKKKLRIGKKLLFSISIPLLGVKPLKLAGEVAWTKTFAIFDEYLVGVRFTDLRQGAKKRLQNLVSFLGTRINPNRRILFKEVKKKPNACVICQFAHKEPTSVLKIISPSF